MALPNIGTQFYYNATVGLLREKIVMEEQTNTSLRNGEKIEISIHLDAVVLEQLKHLTSDPSKVIETAIKEWLKGERDRDDELTRTFRRNPPVPPRGEWND